MGISTHQSYHGSQIFEIVGLTPNEVKIMVNSRALMEQKISELGIDVSEKTKVFNLIDRRDKMSKSEWEAYGRDEGFTLEQIEGFLAIIGDKELYKSSPELMRFFRALDAYGISDYVEFDGRVVRGLDYYTGIVFEARDIGENSRAILGGGRYDNLVGDVGGEPLPGIGFAMGDVVLPIVLKEFNRLPELDLQPAKVLITVFDNDSFEQSISLAVMLRKSGINALVFPDAAKLGKQFKFADRLALNFVLVLGPDEIAKGQVQVKNLKDGEQISIPRDDIAAFIQKHLSV